MKQTMILAVLALCALPALAQSQSVSLIYSQLQTRSYTADSVYPPYKYSTDKPTSLGLRYTHDITSFRNLGDARLAFEGTWVRESGKENIKASAPFVPPAAKWEYTHEYMGLGLSMLWTKVLDFGAALELRHETITEHKKNFIFDTFTASKSFNRPWLSLRTGYTFNMDPVKPFVAFEYNLPLSKKTRSLKTYSMYNADMASNLNPKSQMILNAGIRF